MIFFDVFCKILTEFNSFCIKKKNGIIFLIAAHIKIKGYHCASLSRGWLKIKSKASVKQDLFLISRGVHRGAGGGLRGLSPPGSVKSMVSGGFHIFLNQLRQLKTWILAKLYSETQKTMKKEDDIYFMCFWCC